MHSMSASLSSRILVPLPLCPLYLTFLIGAHICAGTMCISGSIDTTSRLWDVRSGRCMSVKQGHTDEVSWGCCRSRAVLCPLIAGFTASLARGRYTLSVS